MILGYGFTSGKGTVVQGTASQPGEQSFARVSVPLSRLTRLCLRFDPRGYESHEWVWTLGGLLASHRIVRPSEKVQRLIWATAIKQAGRLIRRGMMYRAESLIKLYTAMSTKGLILTNGSGKVELLPSAAQSVPNLRPQRRLWRQVARDEKLINKLLASAGH
ncbi:MAG TPA: hypothetical protein VFZ58_05615 [Candidatus Saccharimonadales bacterium]